MNSERADLGIHRRAAAFLFGVRADLMHYAIQVIRGTTVGAFHDAIPTIDIHGLRT